MNFSFNAWTILFLLSLPFVFFIDIKDLFKSEEPSTPPTEMVEGMGEPVICNPDTLLPRNAETHIQNYRNWKADPSDTSYIPINPYVFYYTIPQCELSQMVTEFGENVPVYANMSINDAKRLSLIFTNTKQDTTNGTFASGTTFYDFTLPCPDLCEPK